MANTIKNVDPISETNLPAPLDENNVSGSTISYTELIEKCHNWILSLCKSGGRSWALRVPADYNHDPDMLFAELLRRYKKTLFNSGPVGLIQFEKKFTKEDLKKAWLHGELRVPKELMHCNNFDVYFEKVHGTTENNNTAAHESL